MNIIIHTIKLVKLYSIHMLLTLSFIIHIAFIGYDIVYPEIPEIKHYSLNLGNTFPLSFSVCVETRQIIMNDGKKIYELGYKHEWDFFYGRSRFNSSIIGWAGHAENGSTLRTVEGIIVCW